MLRAVFITGGGTTRVRSLNDTIKKKMGDQAETFIELHETIANAFHDYDDQERCRVNYQLILAWYEVGKQYLELFQQGKLEQRVLDFDDLEWHTYQLLVASDHAQWIQYKIDNRLSHVLVDEFQDTNQLQWRYLHALLEELANKNEPGQTLANTIIVGDTKQSIYRFRRAEPLLFAQAESWLDSAFNAKHDTLNKSYRSSPAIMEFVNDYFTKCDAEDPSFIAHQTEHQDLPGSVKILQALLPEKEKNKAQPPASFRNPHWALPASRR